MVSVGGARFARPVGFYEGGRLMRGLSAAVTTGEDDRGGEGGRGIRVLGRLG